jgi:hypothetical protein
LQDDNSTEKNGIIYLLTSPSGGRYVGKTEYTLNRRWKQHKQDAANGLDHLLHRAIRKYGAESFTVEEICTAPASWLPAVEIAFIHLLGTFRNKRDYNMTVGGEGFWKRRESPAMERSSAQSRGQKCLLRERVGSFLQSTEPR